MFYDFSISICLRYANNREDAISILNEGFYKIFKQIGNFDIDKPIVPWIRKILINTSIDFYRSNLRFEQNVEIEAYENHVKAEEQIFTKLNYDDLIWMIHQLSPAYRAVFNLYAIEGYSHQEIAESLKISVGTSKSNLSKARVKLMEMVKSANVQPDLNTY
jgi:RNA polymerase sigma factor (sigma-70 family)